MEAYRRLQLSVSAEQDGKTVEQLLRGQLHLSTGCIRSAKRLPEGITLDGVRVFTNAPVRAGQLLTVQVADEPDETVLPVEGPLEIVFEDEDLLILNKPAGLMVHPRAGEAQQTLANYLAQHYRKIGLRADIHLVNRLDRGTSGLMAVAKHPHAHARLIAQLHSDAFVREYLAVCEGAPNPAAGVLDFPIGRCETSAIKREVRPDGAAARTHYRTIASDGRRSLLALRLETGRTHQIRVHLAHIGYPVAGDFLYGEELPELPQRFALHCARIKLLHPITEQGIVQTAPLPPELCALLSPPATNNPLGGML